MNEAQLAGRPYPGQLKNDGDRIAPVRAESVRTTVEDIANMLAAAHTMADRITQTIVQTPEKAHDNVTQCSGGIGVDLIGVKKSIHHLVQKLEQVQCVLG